MKLWLYAATQGGYSGREIALKTPGVHDTIGIAGFSVLTGANSSAAGTLS